MRTTPSEKDLVERLGEVPLFATTSKKHRRSLVRLGRTRTWKQGRTAISEGDAGTAFFLLLDGGVEVTRAGTPIARLSAGDVVGEMALLTNAPRNASVTATQDTSVFELGRPAFTAAIKTDPTMAVALLDAVAQRQMAAI